MKKYLFFVAGLLIVGSLLSAIPALADTTTPPNAAWNGQRGLGRGAFNGQRPAVVGTVSTISGNILTVAGRQGGGFGPRPAAGIPPARPSPMPVTTFSVDATNATIMKNNATSTISSIAVGDTVMVQGTISGTNVTATMIRDGVRAPGQMGQGKAPTGQTPSPILGNGQPVVAGTISVINGSTLTITNKSNVTYTVDASSAKIYQGQNTASTLSILKVGDAVVVQGAVNGTSITASTVIDQAKPAGSENSNDNGGNGKPHQGFFGGIGAFFSHLFGF